MNFPRINKSPARTVNVPVLSGGVNKRDGISLIADNQVTDALNVWFDGGLLKTRPGITGGGKGEKIPLKGNYGQGAYINDITVFDDVTVNIADELGFTRECLLMAVKLQVTGGTKILLLLTSPDGATSGESEQVFGDYEEKIIGDGSTCNYINYNVPSDEISYFAVNCNDKSYLFVSSSKNSIYDIYEIAGDTSRLIPNTEIYAPLVLVNATACDSLYWDLNGVQWESYNMLTNRYKAQYTSVNKSLLKPPSDNPEGEPCHKMTYTLPKSLPRVDLSENPVYRGMYVEVELTNKNGGTVTHNAKFNGNGNAEESEDPGDGLLLTVTGKGFAFRMAGTNTFKTVTSNDYLENDITVTAFYEWDFEQVKNVMCQTKAKWFGGGTEGLMGGTRLFLCGNKEDSKKSLVVWSAKDKPLYFPQNNRFNVGKSNYPVTGFGIMSEMLVIFKPHEVFYTYYAENSGITAEDVINQQVIDYESSAVYFPLITITDRIGCDCPDTVRLCRNRLCWLNSNGKVYTLVSNNNYNERVCFCVSEMLGNELKSQNNEVDGDLTHAKAVDFGDYYMLFVGNMVYMLDYNSYGYTYISSYTKTEDANIKIPWFIWKLPITPKALLQSHSNLGFVLEFNYDGYIAVDCMKLGDGTADTICTPKPVLESNDNIWVYELEEKCIESTFTTKFFDFGAPFYEKEIKKVDIGYGGGADTELSVTYITNEGEMNTDIISFNGGYSDLPKFIKAKQLLPGIKFTRNIAIKVTGIGYMAVEGISITCRLLGGSK